MANFGRNRRAALQREMLAFDGLPREIRDLINYGPRLLDRRDISRIPHLIRAHGHAAVADRLREMNENLD